MLRSGCIESLQRIFPNEHFSKLIWIERHSMYQFRNIDPSFPSLGLINPTGADVIKRSLEDGQQLLLWRLMDKIGRLTDAHQMNYSIDIDRDESRALTSRYRLVIWVNDTGIYLHEGISMTKFESKFRLTLCSDQFIHRVANSVRSTEIFSWMISRINIFDPIVLFMILWKMKIYYDELKF